MGNNLVRSLKGKARSNVLFSLFRFLGVTNVNIKQIENQMKFAQKAKKLVPAKASLQIISFNAWSLNITYTKEFDMI